MSWRFLRGLLALVLVITAGRVSAGCGAPTTSIESIQGAEAESPLAGETVTVEATVTAVFQRDNQLRGYFIQGRDRSPVRSHGLFVYSRSEVAPGERLRIKGRVKEYYGLTELTRVSIEARCGTAALPEPKLLPDAMAPSDRERVEGMRVRVSPSVLVRHDRLTKFGQISIAPRRLFSHHDDAAATAWIVDDASNDQHPKRFSALKGVDRRHPLRLGAKFQSFTGVVGYGYGEYRLYPERPLEPIRTLGRPAAPAKQPGHVRLVGANVHNLFNGAGTGRGFAADRGASSRRAYQRQLRKVSAALNALDADVFVLAEVENDGYGPESTVADLVRALNQDRRPEEAIRAIEFSRAQSGTGAIRNVILYSRSKLMPDGTGRSIAVDDKHNGPVRWHRPTLAQRFRIKFTGQTFTVTANHLKSKAGRCPRDTRASRSQYGACNAERVQVVERINQWMSSSTSADEPVYLVGDFNSYQFEPPIRSLNDSGYANPDLTPGSYSYVYRGVAGTLDYIFANDAGRKRWVTSGYWAINADELSFLDYRKNPTDHQWTHWADTGPTRFSDHDPVYVDIRESSQGP